jgi:hypothetical protein
MKPYYFTILLVICWRCHASNTITNAFDSALLPYNIKTTVEAYENVGHKNPKWNADAVKCLTLFAQIRSMTNGSFDRLIQDLKTNEVRVMTLGCDDPMIRYLYLRFADQTTGPEAAVAMNENASVLQKSDYPDIRKFYATMWARKISLLYQQPPPDAATMLTTASSYLAKALTDKSMPLKEADQACDMLMSAPWWAEPTRWNCYQTIQDAITNNWNGSSFALLTKGRAYLSHGWEARGIGYSDTVTKKGWDLMGERLQIAADALETAWILNSNDVRICREMVRVELGQGKGRERMEMWFQRGMALDPANYDICTEKLEYLRPRWYGSINQMIDFGRECTTNVNYAGDVRLMLVDAHLEASREIQDDAERAAYWKQTNVWSDIQFTYEQFFKFHPDATGYRQYYARNAVRCGQWQEFLNQVKGFAYTNYAVFGGEEQFNRMVRIAERSVKKP